jgi:16S rRNA (cytosine967-C5)-methyltransferase
VGEPAGPRDLAFEVLKRVETSDAYANLLLDASLRRHAMTRPDRALTTELTYGVLRWQGKLDWLLLPVLDRPLRALDRAARILLRLGAYQIACLTRIPHFAAVDETVSLARRVGAARSAGFVNAVLRALIRRPPPMAPDAATDPGAYWQTAGSHPSWLAARWIDRLGPIEAAALMESNNATPPLSIAVNPLCITAHTLEIALRAAVPDVEPSREIPGVFRVRGGGSPDDLPGFAEGHWLPMDEGGVLPVLALQIAPGQEILDACAGGGSKSALLAAAAGPTGSVLALDTSPRAIQRLHTALTRLRIANATGALADARQAGHDWPGRFPRVLVDAPCTGLGTIRRRPEIKWRRRPEDLERASGLQREILRGVAEAVAPGGILVYSTCSLEPEETDAVVTWFLRARADFALAPVAGAGAAFADPERPGLLRAWPHRHGTDGFFVARMRRSA